MPIDPKQVGARIADARNARGWTQLQFALKIGKSPSSVARWERGGLPPVRELIRIAEALGVEPAELIEEPETEKEALLARLDELTEAGDPMKEKLAELRADSKTRARGARQKKA